MNRISGVFKMHFRDRWIWMLGWVILLFNLALQWVIGQLVNNDGTYYSGGLASIFVYMLVAGIVSLSQTFPFAVSFSVTRRDYFVGTIAIAGLLSAITAIGLWLLTIVEKATGGWGNQLIFFDLPYINDGSSLQPIWVSFVLLMHMFLFGFFAGAVFQRFRFVGLFILGVASLIVTTVGIYLATQYQWWSAIWTWIAGQTAVELSWWLVLFTAIYFVGSFVLLRRSTV